MSKDIEITSRQLHTALQGSLRQLGASGIADNFDSVADALHSMDMWDFVFNEASVKAHLHAFSIRDNRIIHELTHG